MLKMVNWAFLLGVLTFALVAPESPFLDRPLLIGYVLVSMVDPLFWDGRIARYRLPFRLPAEAILILPIGLALFATTRVRWHAMEGPDWLRLVIGFAPLITHLHGLLIARWKKPQKAI